MKELKRQIIHKYLNGLLTEEEEALLQQWWRDDPAFREELEYERSVQKAFIRKEREEMKKFLQSIQAPQRNRRKYFLAAASILFMLLAIGVVIFLNEKDDRELYAEFYQAYPNIIAPVVRGENVEDVSQAAFIAYEQEDFATAALLFDDLYAQESTPYAYLYAGISYLMNEDYEVAIKRLTQVRIYSEIAQWYLALAYLGNGQKDLSKDILQELIQNETEFAGRAQLLLNKLQ